MPAWPGGQACPDVQAERLGMNYAYSDVHKSVLFFIHLAPTGFQNLWGLFI